MVLDPYQVSEALASVSCGRFKKKTNTILFRNDFTCCLTDKGGGGGGGRYDKMQNWTGPCGFAHHA